MIPGNDDAIRSCDLIARVVADGIAAGRSKVTTTEMSAPQPAEPAAEERRPTRGSARGRGRGRAEAEPEPAAVAEGGEHRVSTTISASLVKELRDATGAGMMDCKRALEETDGDLDAARTLLRERGMASAGKRAGRETTEGLVGYIVDGSRRLDRRHRLRDRARVEERRVPELRDQGASRCTRGRPGRGRGVRGRAYRARREARREHRGRRSRALRGARRQRSSRRTPTRRRTRSACSSSSEGGSEELARQLAMHISFAAPEWTTRDDVPAEVVSAERSIYLEHGRGAVEARGRA